MRRVLAVLVLALLPVGGASCSSAEASPASPPAVDAGASASVDAAAADAGPSSVPGMPEAIRSALATIGASAVDATGRDGKSIGLAVGVWTPAYDGTLGFGRTLAGTGAAPDGDTVFEIGSVSKVFTGMLLAERVLAGKLSLDDTLASRLPEAPVPTFGGSPIRLGHLASHAAALPSMPDNLTGDRWNPAAGYTRALLWDFLSRTSLPRAPGAAYQYSNLGVGLLGLAISREAGDASFERLVVDRIATPLGMVDTRVDRASYAEARLARGHQGTSTTPPNQIDVLDASGALRSTAKDMLAFVALHASGSGHPLERAAELVRTQLVVAPQGRGCGLAMEIRPAGGLTYVEKTGATSGFSAHILVTRTPAIGVVVLSNSASADVNAVAQQVHDVVRSGS